MGFTYREISEAIEGGVYLSKLPYPQYRPDKAERKKHEAEDRNLRDAYREDDHRLQGVFKSDLRLYAEGEIGQPLTDDQWEAIYRKAWDDGHSSGYQQIFYCVSDTVDIVKLFFPSRKTGTEGGVKNGRGLQTL